VHADKLVLAAGLGNARLAPMVGLNAPVRPQRGQILVTEKLPPFLQHPLVNIRQTDEGSVMIGDSQEEVGLNTATQFAVQQGIAQRAVRLFPRLAQAQIVRSWAALRVMSPDGFPIYDRSTTCPGAYVVTCHSGITLAAAHAGVLARHIAQDDWPQSLAPFSAGRFADVQAA
jgi:glycine/D-amino acid oxidase-like deaminating enzyme